MKQRIGIKLFILLSCLFLLALVPLMYAVFSSVTYFGHYTVEVNREQIKQRSLSYLQTIAREQAHHYESLFSRATLVSSLIAAHARDMYNTLEDFAQMPGESLVFTRNSSNDMLVTSPANEVISLFWGEKEPNEEVSRELLALSRLDRILIRSKREVPEGHATHMITMSGIGRYMSYKEALREAVYRLPPARQFDLRDGEPVTIFTDAAELIDETRMTRVYKDDVIEGLVITATSPVIDNNGVLRAVAGVDVPLDGLVTSMATMAFPEARDDLLFSFILDNSGRLIAFPPEYLDFFGIHIDWTKFENSGDILQYNLFTSSREELKPLFTNLFAGRKGSGEVELDGEVYILTQHEIRDLDWHLVLVSREAKLISSIEQTEVALGGIIQQLINKFGISAIMILVFVLVAVFLAVRHFVSPLTKLSQAALRVGEGDLTTRYHLNRSDELGSLADSFNAMVQRLEAAEKIQKKQAKQLELAVEEQTRDLRLKNFELQDVISRLNVESEQRKRAVVALEQSEEQIRTAMDASLAGLCIVQGVRFTYINPAFARVFGYSIEEMLGDFDPMQMVVPELRELVKKEWLDIVSGKSGRTKSVRCVRKNGTTFEAISGGDLTVWQGRPAVVATIMDISEQKKAEQQLIESTELLQDSLKEKEVLMREIYHRTKNNMLVIISMLNLQAMDIEDQGVIDLFRETENRIRAMSLAHEKLYQSQNLSEVDLAQYLEDMVRTLVQNMVIGDRIGVKVASITRVPISLDAIVPLGLAVNEIVTNSIKHAYPDNGSGHITVGVDLEDDGTMVVQVGDDGKGLPPGINLYTSPSLGLQITVNLIEKQLHGSLEVHRDNGTKFIIRFKEMARPKRI